MTELEFLESRFAGKFSDQAKRTRDRIAEIDQDNRVRNTYGSGHHLTSVAKTYIEGVEQVILAMVNELRQESMKMSAERFNELWGVAGIYLNDQVGLKISRCRHEMRGRFEQTGHWGQSEDILMRGLVEQHVSDFRLNLHHRIKEVRGAYELFVVPGREATNALIGVVVEVRRLLATQADVAAFVRDSSERLGRIESELSRQGLDVQFAADVLTQQFGERHSNKGAIDQLVFGIGTNGAYDVIKAALLALGGIAG
ncbi:hypothetical protein [Myxococcus xanthus]|uniref:hypothetical protein n=1 Tax=Myxococcus xanthus TaxID=34 RepID=UPI00112A8FBB|nr:hypothetical protein [Myxococcus xanthus]